MLDVGCGEGVLTAEWAERLGDGRIVGIDLDDPKLKAEWARASAPNLEFRCEEATSLTFGDDEFDMASAIEVLEHVPDPAATVAEMARVAKRHLLVSVPARAALARAEHGARRLPARPRQHAGARQPLVEAGVHGAARATRHGRGGPLAVPVDHAACPPRLGATARARAILSVGIGATGLITFGYFALASHALDEADYGRISLLWSAIFIIVSVLYRPVEQLLSRTIADHDARGIQGRDHLRVAATIQLALGRRVRGRCAGAARPARRTTSSAAPRRSTGS